MLDFTKFFKIFDNARARLALVVFTAMVIAGGALVIVGGDDDPFGVTESRGAQVPQNIDSTPGSVTNEAYTELLIQANKQRAEEAAAQNSSAMPTMIAYRTDADCEHGRYNKEGECDPNGIFDKDGNQIYDEFGNALCPENRYDQKGNCDPNGLYDINGNLIYDEFGNVICNHGKYDAQGRCDRNGKYDANGNLLSCPHGKYDAEGNCDPYGQYDVNGNLLSCPHGKFNKEGLCDPNGYYDINGNLIGCPFERYNEKGECDEYGKYDKEGNPLPCESGRYNEQGQCDPNGMYDINGNKIDPCPSNRFNKDGKCDPNGKYDASGNELCKSRRYNEQGQCDPNGKYDVNGQIVCELGRYNARGECDPTGLYDANGRIYCPEGKFDREGRCDPENGLYGPDGRLLCPDGRYDKVGKCDPNGIYDADGNVLAQFKGETDLERRLREQRERQERLRAERDRAKRAEEDRAEALAMQKAFQKEVQELSTAMSGQATAMMTAWNTIPVQAYVAGTYDSQRHGGARAVGSGSSEENEDEIGKPKGPVIKAGSILYGVLDTGLNSDEPSPVLATVVHGKLKGAKLIGKMGEMNDYTEKVVISFGSISFKNYPTTIKADIVAVDPETSRTALASDVDHHYLLRYGTLFASSFMEGFAEAVKEQGTTTVTQSTGATTEVKPQLSTSEQIWTGLGTVGEKWGKAVAPLFNRPYTITVDAGTAVGLLLLSDLELPEDLGR